MTDLSRLLAPVLDQIHKLWTRVDQMPIIRWGIVATVSPLRVALDGSIDENDNPVLAPAQSAVSDVTTGMRVLCVEQHRRVIIIQAITPTP